MGICALSCALSCARETQPSVTVTLDAVAEGFTHPVALREVADGSGRLFVVDQVGTIWIIDATGRKLEQPFLDLSAELVELDEGYDERGLLGLAFDPEFAETGLFYVYYSAPLRAGAIAGFDHTNVLAEYRVSADDPDLADRESGRRLLEIDLPYSNHNGGTVAFGPDGLLYLAIGDGGNRDDEDAGLIPGHVDDWYDVNGGGNGQDIENNLLGSILRIEVGPDAGEHGEHGEHGEGTAYGIPDDNPFVDTPGVLPEIWAYGLRNPYRFSFDPAGAHALIAGDVGQEMFEEIDVIEAGGNYGWNVYEGEHCFNAASPLEPLPSCPIVVGPGHPATGAPLLPPVIELKNTNAFPEDGVGLAIVGGVVNRGDALGPELAGRYLFGVWSVDEEHGDHGERHLPGRLLVATMQPEGRWPWQPVKIAGLPEGELDGYLLGFGQDLAGDVYVLTSEAVGPTGDSGKVRRMVGTN